MKLYALSGSLAAVKAAVACSYAGKALQVLGLTSEMEEQFGSLGGMFEVYLLSGRGVFGGEKAVLSYIAQSSPESGLGGESWYEGVGLLSYLDMQAKLEASMRFGEAVGADLGVAKLVLKSLEEVLFRSTYLMGHHVTIADVAVAVVLNEGMSASKFDDDFMQHYPSVRRWLSTVTAQKQFVAVAKKDAVKKKPAVNQKDEGEQTASAKKKDAQEEENEGEVVALPILEKWKKVFSNSKDLKGEAMPWFWQNFNLTTDHSLWFMKYNKLPTECKMSFLTCNLMNGFMQRVDDKMRNESFGVIMVVGDGDDFDIQGVWLFAGQDIPSLLKQHPSFEYNDFVKLSHTSDSDKQLVADHWCLTESIQNRTIVSIKTWK